jgi:hypothetical protein
MKLIFDSDDTELEVEAESCLLAGKKKYVALEGRTSKAVRYFLARLDLDWPGYDPMAFWKVPVFIHEFPARLTVMPGLESLAEARRSRGTLEFGSEDRIVIDFIGKFSG